MLKPQTENLRNGNTMREELGASSSLGLGIAIGAVLGAAGILIWIQWYTATHPPEDLMAGFIFIWWMPVALVLGGICGGIVGCRIPKPEPETLAGDLKEVAWPALSILAFLMLLWAAFMLI